MDHLKWNYFLCVTFIFNVILGKIWMKKWSLPYVYLCAKALSSDQKVNAAALNWQAIVVVLCYTVTIRDLWAPKMLDLQKSTTHKHLETVSIKNVA